MYNVILCCCLVFAMQSQNGAVPGTAHKGRPSLHDWACRLVVGTDEEEG